MWFVQSIDRISQTRRTRAAKFAHKVVCKWLTQHNIRYVTETDLAMHHAKKEGLRMAEHQLQAKSQGQEPEPFQYELPVATPDILFLDRVHVTINEMDASGKIVRTVSIKDVHWIECKSTLGAFLHYPTSVVTRAGKESPIQDSTLSLSTAEILTKALRYSSLFGKGLVIFEHGLTSSWSEVEEHLKEKVAFVDASTFAVSIDQNEDDSVDP